MASLRLQLVETLSSQNSIWDRCCGPNGQGISFSDLLELLQARYPESAWTEETLDSYIDSAKSQGRVKELPTNSYYMNSAMILVNQSNRAYSTVPGVCLPASGLGCRTGCCKGS